MGSYALIETGDSDKPFILRRQKRLPRKTKKKLKNNGKHYRVIQKNI